MFKYFNTIFRSGLKRNRAIIQSWLVFSGCILLLAAAYSRVMDTSIFALFLSASARVSAGFLNGLGLAVTVSGSSISSSEFSVSIGTGCDGLVPIMIFVSAVLAYPSNVRAKAFGILVGVFCLYFLNIIRIISLFYIGLRFYSFFDTAHLLLWQSITILAAIVLWLFWQRRIAHVEMW